jgi:hypothetical protein
MCVANLTIIMIMSILVHMASLLKVLPSQDAGDLEAVVNDQQVTQSL